MTTFINLLTLSRIFLAAIIFLLLMSPDGYLLALILFFIAGTTDYFDGYLARKYNATSQLGEILDPIADKILVLFLIIALSIHLSSSFIGICGSLILAREFWVGALRDLNARKNNSAATKVTLIAKFKTTSQFMTFSSYLLALTLKSSLLMFTSHFFLFLTLVITLQTGLSYTITTLKTIK
jgi:CDP-diacylglycerol--glycerol-3-phosphate 3-phosphatidyltransferase